MRDHGFDTTYPQKLEEALNANPDAKVVAFVHAVSNLLGAERGDVTKGSITFKGEDVHSLTPNELVRRGVIQVMEGRHCFEHLTVEENLLTGAYTGRGDGYLRSGSRVGLRTQDC